MKASVPGKGHFSGIEPLFQYLENKKTRLLTWFQKVLTLKSHLFAWEVRYIAQFLFNAQQLIVFRHPV
jgi:hypothetical protein